MKITHVANMAMGGISRLVTDLANEQCQLGHKVQILSPLSRENFFADELHKDIAFKMGKIHSGYSLNISIYRKMAKDLSDQDFVHFHAFNPLLILMLRRIRIKMVYTEHGTFQKSHQLNSLKNIIKKRILGRFILRKFVDGIAFNSKWMQMNSGLSNTSQVVIHNGIPTQNITNPKMTNQVPELLFVGRIEAKKRLDLLLDTLDQIAGPQLIFHVVGSGTLLPFYKNKVGNMSSAHQIVFHGQQSNPDTFYKNAQLFLLGSRDEPFGLVVLEALKYGCLPLIFSDAGGANEILEGVSEKIIARDLFAMAKNISYWLSNESERIQIIEKLQLKMHQQFSSTMMCNSYLEYYKQIQNSRKF